jgi:hypothetical protein
VSALYNVELFEIMQFIYTQLKIPPTSKVKIEYDAETLLSIVKIDDSNDMSSPPFSIMCLEISKSDNNDSKKLTKLAVRREIGLQLSFMDCLIQVSIHILPKTIPT